MLLLDRQPIVVAPRCGGGNRVQLRFRADGQLLELPPGKTTIGSSPRCDVRIQQPGIQPLHCLIVHEAGGLTIRRWAGDALLNGVPFKESALAAGDCLSVGPVELDIVDPQVLLPPTEPVVTSASDAKAVGQFRAGRDLARTRSRELLAALRRERTAQAELRQQAADLQEELLQGFDDGRSIQGELESGMAELAAARLQLAEHKSLGTAHQELVKQNGQLGLEIRELTARVKQMTYEQTEAANERTKLLEDGAALKVEHQRIVDENLLLQSQAGEIKNQIVTLGGERDELRRQNERLRADSQALSQRFAAEKATSVEEHNNLVGERDGLRRQNDQLRTEAQSLAKESAAIANERTTLYRERNELQLHCDGLNAHLDQLAEENSAMAIAKLAALELCDTLGKQNDEFQARVEELNGEVSTLAAAKTVLSEELAHLRNENKRLAEVERDMREAVVDRESTSAELYRALLQLAELQSRIDQNKMAVACYESLKNEHEQLVHEAAQLKDQFSRQSEEQAAVEDAWQALSDEAATLSESQQRLAEENATLVDSLNETRQQLDKAQQDQVAISGTVTELERDLAVQRQAELAAVAAADEVERQLAEQARQFSESVNRLEQQLAAAGNAQESLERARNEWQLHQANADRCSTDQARRIAELERELAAARAEAARLAERPAVSSEPIGNNESSAPVERIEVQAELASNAAESISESATPVAPDCASEFTWSSNRGEAFSQETPHESGGEAGEVANESQPWGSSFPAHSPFSGNALGDDSVSSLALPESSNWPLSAAVSVPNDPRDQGTSFAESVIWNRAADELLATSSNHAAVGPADSLDRPGSRESEAELKGLAASAERSPSRSDDAAASKTGSTSFIERYSHLFTEDGPAREDAPIPARQQPANGSAPNSMAGNIGVVRSNGGESNSTNADEESIEEYMAKLLQRVRGDAPYQASSQAMPTASAPSAVARAGNGQAGSQPAPPTAVSLISTFVPDQAESDEGSMAPAPQPVAVKRKASIPAPTTDMGALRAFANETARRAIGRHELVKLRRNAVTKVIVSTLAGVTSLWMMLDSPDWRTVQFITGCVSLIVAAYWAGETFRTLLESLRIAANDGAESDEGHAEAALPPALPIDVEPRS